MPRLVHLGEPTSNGKSPYLNLGVDGSNIFKYGLPTNVSPILSEMNKLFPEGVQKPTASPNQIKDINIDLIENAEMVLTFITEGAGYTNTYGYFMYPTNNAPSDWTKLGDLIIVYPNASLSGSGGSMTLGDSIMLPYAYDTVQKLDSKGNQIFVASPKNYTFPSGTSICFFIVQNAWNGSSVKSGNTKFYSLSRMNPEPTPSKKYHFCAIDSIQLPGKFWIGVEDLYREWGADNDFNDCVTLCTVTPYKAIAYNSISRQIYKNSPPLKNFTYGFKKVYHVREDNSIEECVATLRIPSDADVRNNSKFCPQKKRTNKAYVESIVVVKDTHKRWNTWPWPKVGASVDVAHSGVNSSFLYKEQDWVFSTISDDQTQHDWLEGIHFFTTYEEAEKYFFPI